LTRSKHKKPIYKRVILGMQFGIGTGTGIEDRDT
jgi:hypothetical protein